MRRLTYVAAAAIGVTLTLAGCSSSDSGNPQNTSGSSNSAAPTQGSGSTGGGAPQPPPPAPSGGDPVKWADNLCAPIGDFTKSLSTKMGELGQVSDQAQMQQKFGQLIDDMAGGLGGAVDRLKQLEPSPIPDGDKIKNTIIDSYAKSQTALKQAGAKMKSGDQDAAAQVMQSLGEEASKMVDPFNGNDTPQLREAMGKAQRCKDIAGG